MKTTILLMGAVLGLGLSAPVVAGGKNTEVDNGWNPLSGAVMTGNVLRLEEVIESGLNVNVREAGPWRRSPLHLAAGYKDERIAVVMVKRLLEAGAEVNAEMTSGVTPLHEAARRGSMAVVHLLLKEGAKVNPVVDIRNCLDPHYELNDMTPLDVARKFARDEVVEILVGAGAKGQPVADQAGDDRHYRQMVNVRTKTFMVGLRRAVNAEKRNVLRDFIDPEYLREHGLEKGELPIVITPVMNIYNIALGDDRETIAVLVDAGDERKKEVLVLRGVLREGQLYFRPAQEPSEVSGSFVPWVTRIGAE